MKVDPLLDGMGGGVVGMQGSSVDVVALSTGSGALGGSRRRDEEDLLVVLPTGLLTLSTLGLLLCSKAAA